MTWKRLFERASAYDVTPAELTAALRERREGSAERSDADADAESHEPSPARVVVDADVLAADLFGDDDARAAMDGIRRHSWVTLVASDPLADEATALVSAFGDADLAADWRARFDECREAVTHPAGDHPALASALRGGAMHLLTFDEGLQRPGAGAALNARFPLSVRHPRAFAALFDAESLYREVEDGAYPGPDRDPRA